jgi:hypothetical protein
MPNSIILPLRVMPQPMPFIVPGGDCGACVLSGLSGKTIPEIYRLAYADKPEAISLFEMKRALRCGETYGWDDYQEDWPVMWSAYWEPWQSFGLQAFFQATAWFKYVKMALEAGYYGICNVRHDKTGPFSNGPDHWVLICGAQTVKVPLSGGGARMDDQVLVSCSARATPDEEWVEARKFLKERGGFNILLVRPASR